MKNVLLTLFLLVACIHGAFAQTALYGTVTDDTGESVIFASIVLYKNDILIDGRETDFDGHYRFDSLDAGTYEVEASYVGYETKRIKDVNVYAGKANRLDIKMESGATLQEVVVTDYKIPLIKHDNTTMGATIATSRQRSRKRSKGSTANRIKNLPTRNINGLSSNVAGLSKKQRRKLKRKASKSGESYATIVENSFLAAKDQSFSTFAIDVDGAAYSNARRFIQRGQLPPKDAIRTEEFINYFSYDYPIPQGEHPFSVHTELSECPWSDGHQLLHIGLRGYEASPQEAPPANLVFLIDVSGSMSGAKKLPLVKQSLSLLVEQLRAKDRVAIVTYAGAFEVALLPTTGDQKDTIKQAINKLGHGGGTAGGAALQRAYELAEQYYLPEGSNRIILATDGDFNIGIASPEALEQFIVEKRESGVALSVLGFGTGNYKDDRMEVLANKGNGNYAYIDGIKEAEKVLITEMAGTLFTIAKDVKLQVEFDPKAVAQYRLIGYENRLLAKEDFEDDTKDAGELGAGHTVTALYEIVPNNADAEQLATLHLRYKRPEAKQSFYLKHQVQNSAMALNTTSENFRFSAAVASYALCLMDSEHKGKADYGLARQLADTARQDDLEGYRADFVELIDQTSAILKQTTNTSE